MNRLKELIELGFLIDETAKEDINSLNDENYKKLVEALKKEYPLVISQEFIKKLFIKEVKILKTFKKRDKLTIKDFVRLLNEKYNTLQKILLEKLELKDVVSINKCGSGNVTVIGMIKAIEERGKTLEVFIEDPTGEIRVSMHKNMGSNLSLDDVVAISGNINNKILFLDKIIYPDISLRPVNYSDEPVKVAFVSEEKEIDLGYVAMNKGIKDNFKNKFYDIEIPTLIEISGIKILIIGDFEPLMVLKKRYLNKENTDFIIDVIPDLVFSNKDINKNYKGVTIISPNNIIDLKTREINKIL